MNTHRPYARGDLPSVTQILGLLDKPGLRWAASKETALYAVNNQRHWRSLQPDEATSLLYKHHDALWRSKAGVGTMVHAVIEEYVKGHDVDLEELVQEEVRSYSLLREAPLSATVELIERYIVGVEKWWNDFTPYEMRSEIVVRYPSHYIGTVDLLCQIDGERWILDWKTTSETTPEKGVYVTSWLGQLVAYSYATEELIYGPSEDGKLVEIASKEWRPPDHIGVVHLRGDNAYTFYELPLQRKHHEAFLAMCEVYRWRESLPTELPQVRKENHALI